VAERKHITRSLRFTLTAVYTAVFALILLGVIILFRQKLKGSLEDQAIDELNKLAVVVHGNLHIFSNEEKKFYTKWYLDTEDPDENSIKGRLQKVIYIVDSKGRPLELSPAYEALGVDSSAQIQKVLNAKEAQWIEKTAPDHVSYLIREFYVYGEDSRTQKFFVAIGTSLANNQAVLSQFTWLCIGLFPLMIIAGCALGWVFAGRALTPVLEIARTAQRISGSNLNLRIPSRKAGDELDYLIETFNQMIDRIEVNFNQVRQFSTDVSHELRTPITVVRGQLEVALFTAKTEEQYRDAIITSLSDIERLSAIVRALLLLSQAETGQVILQKQTLDLVDMAENITDQFQIPAEGAEVKLTYHADCDRCLGEFDRIQIERMLSNLLSNSIKFTPPGGTIDVFVEDHGDEAELRVSDTGQGIPAEHLPHIFDRFYRVRGPNEQASPEKGLGLGLSFVSWIVRAHGGTVDVTSQPGEGTTFRIRLPLRVPDAPENTPIHAFPAPNVNSL
jgi:heavy metal sensor kinase